MAVAVATIAIAIAIAVVTTMAVAVLVVDCCLSCHNRPLVQVMKSLFIALFCR